MAKRQKVGREVSTAQGSEFFRGKEHIFDGGEKAVVSPVGSAFGYPIVHSNALERGLNEESKAGRVISRPKGGK